jgi:hypothetical protein
MSSVMTTSAARNSRVLVMLPVAHAPGLCSSSECKNYINMGSRWSETGGELQLSAHCSFDIPQTNSVALSPQANYTD